MATCEDEDEIIECAVRGDQDAFQQLWTMHHAVALAEEITQGAFLLAWQRILQADMLVVHWLGRSRMCHGLHALANYSSTPYRRQWSEPSLAERIERVCGPRIEANDERLTMVR